MRAGNHLKAIKHVRAFEKHRLGIRSTRPLHNTPPRPTDGVYTALTEMRVKTPWIEALRKQREEGMDPTRRSSEPTTPSDRDLTPKKMSDSFHRVVR